MIKKTHMLTLAAGLAALTLTACSDDDDNNPVSSTPNSSVMVVHASPNAPAVDLLVDNSPALSGLAFPNNTGYVPLPSGQRNVKVNAANSTTTVINENLNLDPNKNYTVFAVDSLSKIDVVVLEDNLAAPAAGKAHVRFVHLSPNAPAVDVAVTGGPVLFPNVSFKGSIDFTPVDAGTYNLEVRLYNSSTVVLPLPNITLQDGKIYTVFAKGFAGATGATALGAEIILNN
jgi:hypothetical protein